MNKIDYIELGGTLFIQSTHKDLEAVASGEKYPNLKSLVIDTEDGIAKDELIEGVLNIRNLLQNLQKSNTAVFIRPRDVVVLRTLLGFENIEKIDGFILPKFSLSNANEYLNELKDTLFMVMPSIEGVELFNQVKLRALCDLLMQHKERILLIRFGLEDMLRQLKMRRECHDNIFDISAPASVLGNFIAIFKSAGFQVSGGVYPCYKDFKGFVDDVRRDLKEGLISKTIIHPNQIDLLNKEYKVSQREFDEALEISTELNAVFAQNAKMAETTTMTPWAQEIIKRAEVYGIK